MSGAWSKLKKALSFKGFGSNCGSNRQFPSSPPPTAEDIETTEATAAVAVAKTSGSSLSDSFSALFSRSFSYSSKRSCAICLGNVKSGQGQAIFTAECSHSFHFKCIANSVKHGNYGCPICRSKWKDIPFHFPNSNGGNIISPRPARVPPENNVPNLPNIVRAIAPPPSSSVQEPLHYSDDEPLLANPTGLSPSSTPSQNVTIRTFSEFPALAASESVSKFAVLVGVQAPPLLDDARHLERAPIDLVTVLDVSGSMSGSKLALVKRAVHFVVENLSASDRLSIVVFSTSAYRIFPLRRMTEQGREEAKRSMDSLLANGGTNIVAGLQKGAQVLEDRRELNPVASIILLSDGRDNFSVSNSNYRQISRSEAPSLLNPLPASICPANREVQDEGQHLTVTVHTFGFGADHDASAMHIISDASGGTFSSIQSIDMVQDGFARCIGGLLSVVAQQLKITVTSASPGVEIRAIPSGKYASEISEQGCVGRINVGELYAEEEKEFLVYLSVPSFPAPDDDEERERKTLLLDVTCTYKDTVLKEMVQVNGRRIDIWRPKVVSPTNLMMSLEVDRQKNRIAVSEGITEAHKMAEAGNLPGAKALLTSKRAELLSSAAAQAGDSLCVWLEKEVSEIREKMVSQEVYERTGRSYTLSGLSSHSWQRATTRGDNKEAGSSSSINIRSGPVVGYDTPSMVTMVSKSQNLTQLAERANKTGGGSSRSSSLIPSKR